MELKIEMEIEMKMQMEGNGQRHGLWLYAHGYFANRFRARGDRAASSA